MSSSIEAKLLIIINTLRSVEFTQDLLKETIKDIVKETVKETLKEIVAGNHEKDIQAKNTQGACDLQNNNREVENEDILFDPFDE